MCLLRLLTHYVCDQITAILTPTADIAAVAALQLVVVSLSHVHLASSAFQANLLHLP
jgi:hypothetical protein